MSGCLVKLSLIKDSKILLILGRRLIGRCLPRSDLSSSFLKTGTTNEDFQQEGKQDSAKQLFYSLARTGECSGEHILRTIAGILSGASGFGCFKIVDCTRDLFGGDILSLKVSVQYWKIGKLLRTIINGEIA